MAREKVSPVSSPLIQFSITSKGAGMIWNNQSVTDTGCSRGLKNGNFKNLSSVTPKYTQSIFLCRSTLQITPDLAKTTEKNNI